MKNILIIIGLSACFAIFAFSGDDNAVEKTMEIPEFTQLEIKLPCEVSVRQHDKQSLRIVTDEETFSKINTNVTDGILRISIDKWLYSIRRNRIKVYVATKSLEKIRIASAASLTLEKNTFALKNISLSGASSVRGETKTDALELHVSGASKSRLDIKADVLNVNLSGASSMFLSGHVAKQYINVSGASKIDASALKGGSVDIKGGGASKITVGTPISHISVSGATQVSKQ
jgi:hypothetical protein